MFVPLLHPSPLRKQGSSLFHLFSGFLPAQERRDVTGPKTPENESPELLPGFASLYPAYRFLCFPGRFSKPEFGKQPGCPTALLWDSLLK